jgi:hypothetical protein
MSGARLPVPPRADSASTKKVLITLDGDFRSTAREKMHVRQPTGPERKETIDAAKPVIVPPVVAESSAEVNATRTLRQ